MNGAPLTVPERSGDTQHVNNKKLSVSAICFNRSEKERTWTLVRCTLTDINYLLPLLKGYIAEWAAVCWNDFVVHKLWSYVYINTYYKQMKPVILLKHRHWEIHYSITSGWCLVLPSICCERLIMYLWYWYVKKTILYNLATPWQPRAKIWLVDELFGGYWTFPFNYFLFRMHL